MIEGNDDIELLIEGIDDIELYDVTGSGYEIPWKAKKRASLVIADSLKRLGYTARARNMKFCCETLNYSKNLETYGMRLTKKNLRFCKSFLCPICQSRRSVANYHRLKNVLNRMKEIDGKEPTLIFITLTVKNVPKEAFSSAIENILKGWKKIERRAKFGQILGSYRSLEVTVPNANEFHPHLHILCLVDKDYFKKENTDYIATEELVKMWQKSLSIDYKPICYMQRVKGDKGVLEVSKYLVKSSDIINNRTPDEIDQIVDTLLKGISGRRLVSFGGRFKQIDQELRKEQKKAKTDQTDPDDEDLFNLTGNHEKTNDIVTDEEYRWSWQKMNYIRVNTIR